MSEYVNWDSIYDGYFLFRSYFYIHYGEWIEGYALQPVIYWGA